MATIDVTDETFDQLVLESDTPVLVDFWAAWCQPCRLIGPIVEELSEEYAGSVVFAKLDIDKNPAIQARYRVSSIPLLVLFRRGQQPQAVQGAVPKQTLVAFLEKAVPGLGGATSIAPKQLKERLDRGDPIRIFDLRREQDFGRSHIRRSKVVAPEALAAAVEAVPPEQTIVLVCRTGQVSKDAAKGLKASGKSILVLEKGLLEWEGAGLQTYSNREAEEADRSGAA